MLETVDSPVEIAMVFFFVSIVGGIENLNMLLFNKDTSFILVKRHVIVRESRYAIFGDKYPYIRIS